MGIKEKDLQTVESLQSGDKIRIVTGGGNSRNIDAGAVGGGGIFKVLNNGFDVLDKTYNEISNAVSNGNVPVLVMTSHGVTTFEMITNVYFYEASGEDPAEYGIVTANGNQYTSLTPDGELIRQVQ